MRTLRFILIVLACIAVGIRSLYHRIRYGKQRPDLPVIISEAARETNAEVAQSMCGKRVDDAMRDGEMAILYQDKPSRWC